MEYRQAFSSDHSFPHLCSATYHCATLRKLLSLPVSRFAHLKNEDISTTYIITTLLTSCESVSSQIISCNCHLGTSKLFPRSTRTLVPMNINTLSGLYILLDCLLKLLYRLFLTMTANEFISFLATFPTSAFC